MLRAASLIYAIFISFIIAVTCSSFILGSFYNEQYISVILAKNKLLSDSRSGIQLLLSNQSDVLPNESKQVDLFDDGEHIVELKRFPWGVFEVIGSKATWKQHVSNKIALSGANIMQEEKVALYLTDRNKPLALCGKTLIKGNCFLPKSGVKRAYIEGQHFSGKELINGNRFTSNFHLPTLNELVIEASNSYLKNISTPSDSVVHIDDLTSTDSIIHPFTQRTLLIHSENPILISNLYLKGNIIIRSEVEVKMAPNSKAEDILMYAPKIHIQEGFNGTIQLYASDSLIISEKCTLRYPSSLALVNSRIRDEHFALVIKKNTVVEGAVLLHNPYQTRKSSAYLTIMEGALVKGQVYCDDRMQLNGKIHGSLYCNKFTLKTPSSIYENHLLNAEIDRTALSDHFVGIPLLEANHPKKIVKWLN